MGGYWACLPSRQVMGLFRSSSITFYLLHILSAARQVQKWTAKTEDGGPKPWRGSIHATPTTTMTFRPSTPLYILPYFLRFRHYGLHAGSTYRKYRPLIPTLVKQNGHTIRTLFQILRLLLGIAPDECPICQGTNFEYSKVPADTIYIRKHILHNRSPTQTAARA